VAATDVNMDSAPEEWEGVTVAPAEAEQQLALGGRIGNWKTLLSFVVAVVVMAFAIYKGGINPAATWSKLRTLNLGLFFGAFVVYYTTFPLRGLRWRILLENAYRDEDGSAVKEMSVTGLTEIIYISWFVNCVVPAKLGDLYRAYLAKLWVNVSWTKTVGTVLAERIVDVIVLSFLMAGTGFFLFHNKLGHVSAILLIGIALAVIGVAMLVVMKTMSRRIQRLVPQRFLGRYMAFEEGALQSFRRIPLLFGVTALIWIIEGGRVQLVFAALGIHVHVSHIPFIPVLFFALATAVLTTIPFTPGGLGLVEVGLLSIMVYLGVPKIDAAAVVLVDRLLSYYSIAILGFVVYLLSKRSHFRAHL
jgi:glycosyltransferase 2 family protein